jgi:hypothetical protein
MQMACTSVSSLQESLPHEGAASNPASHLHQIVVYKVRIIGLTEADGSHLSGSHHSDSGGVMNNTKRLSASFAISFAVHAAAAVALLFTTPEIAHPPQGENAVSVVMVTMAPKPPQQPAKSTEEEPAPAQSVPSASQAVAPQPPESPSPQTSEQPSGKLQPEEPAPAARKDDGMIRATTLYAASVLGRPENREALYALATISPAERMEQLCDTEGMEQLHRWRPALQPDRLIAYALGSTESSSGRIIAKGAAFRSQHTWYALVFDCSFSPGNGEVTAFSFKAGDPIPKERWADLMLEQ